MVGNLSSSRRIPMLRIYHMAINREVLAQSFWVNQSPSCGRVWGPQNHQAKVTRLPLSPGTCQSSDRRLCNSSIVNYSQSSLITILKCATVLIFFQPYEGFQKWLIGSESLAVLQINISDGWISESIFLIKYPKYFLTELPIIAVCWHAFQDTGTPLLGQLRCLLINLIVYPDILYTYLNATHLNTFSIHFC